jgi:hypothetical protein
MFRVLVRNDNSVIVTENQRIMQGSKLVDVLQIMVPKTYNELNMQECTAYLNFITPINHKIDQVELTITDDNYENDYLCYQMSVNTNLTTEVGDIQFFLEFIQVDMTEAGEVKTSVRKTDVFIMSIIPVADWFVVPDELLNTLDQRLIAQQQAIKAMADLQNTLAEDKLDDIKLDVEAGTLYGTSGGVRKGTGVKISDLGDAIANDTKDGMVVINTYDVKDEE